MDSPFALDPRLARDGATAYLALWTYAASYEDALAHLPAPLHPQLAIATPAGVAMVWIPRTPCMAGLETEAVDALVLLAAIADALNTVPPGPDDGIPLPRSEADLVAVTTDTYADVEALWSWAHQLLEDRKQQTALDLERAARAAGRNAGAEDSQSVMEDPTTPDADEPHDLVSSDPWATDDGQ